MLEVITDVISLLTVYLCLLMCLSAKQQITCNQYCYFCHIMFKIKLIRNREIRCITSLPYFYIYLKTE